MSDSKIIIFYERLPILIRIYIFFIFFLGNLGNYKIKAQKNQLVLDTKLNSHQKMDFIRKLFIIANLLEVTRVKTTY
jgi:hypothetical protein